jgi:hypothetical protein
LAVQKVHEKNGAKFYSEANITELTVRQIFSVDIFIVWNI